MIEKRFSTETVPYFSTEYFHLDRGAAHHLEQSEHRSRLMRVADIIRTIPDIKTIMDLGSGDGGLLSLLREYIAWGFDFCPANVKYANENRRVKVYHANILDVEDMMTADLAIMTEILEHLADPHSFLKKLFKNRNVRYIICSSPYNETGMSEAGSHVWTWDKEGYKKMIENAGWSIVSQEEVEPRFQIILAKK